MITPWVMRLIIANVIVFLLTAASPLLTDAFMFVPVLILSKPWTIVTYMFLHGGFSHIFFNMLGLFFFGPRLELELGGKNFLLLYFISGIMGAVLSIFFTPHTAIIGASGAVYGIMLGFAYFWPREKIFIWGVFPVESRWLVVVMTGFSLYGGFGGSGDGVAHFAHLGGFVGGFLFLRFVDKHTRGAQYQQQFISAQPSSTDIERWSKIRREGLHEVNREELDRILTKLNTTGAEGLTPTEIAFLNRFSAG